MSELDELTDVVARLRAPDGCPWDRAQTPQTVRKYLLEEAYEVVGAIDGNDDDELRGELGDLLFNIVLLARMAEERGAFTLTDVIATIRQKMVHRHPHVFDRGEGPAPDRAQIAAAWEALKAEEQPGRSSVMDGLPGALPALIRAERVSNRAAQLGFDWPDANGPRAKIDEEVAELDEAIAAGDIDGMTHEIGDVLLATVNLARHLPVSGAEDCMRAAARRFEARFRHVEGQIAASGRAATELDLDTLEAFWRKAKEVEE